jgi:hypothetical protein
MAEPVAVLNGTDVAAVVATAPPLTPELAAKLGALLRAPSPCDGKAAADAT